jgi:REP element-mobilizing transposase RayT
MAEFRIYRRRLPHWRVDGAAYFVTWRLAAGAPDLDAVERDTVRSALLHFNGTRYTLFACVVMNDHVHALVEPAAKTRLEELIHTWKSFTANQCQKSGRTGRVWQPEYWDRVVRDEGEFEEALRYIARNPFIRWPEIESYPWIWIEPTAYE